MVKCKHSNPAVIDQPGFKEYQMGSALNAGPPRAQKKKSFDYTSTLLLPIPHFTTVPNPTGESYMTKWDFIQCPFRMLPWKP